MGTQQRKRRKWQNLLVVLAFLGLSTVFLPLRGAEAVVTVTGCGADEICTLQELIANNGTITVDDKIFSNFSGAVNGEGDYTPTTTAGITVSGVNINGLEGIQITGGIFTAYIDGVSSTDVALSYDVTATAGLISDIHLFANIWVDGSGFGFVDEVAYVPGVGDTLCEASVSQNDQTDDCFLDVPRTSIHVTKDIYLTALVPGSSARVSIIDQLVSQVPYEVPEPSALLLLGTGLLGVAVWGRRKYGNKENRN